MQTASDRIEVKFPSIGKFKIGELQKAEFSADFSLIAKNFGLSRAEIRQQPFFMDMRDIPGVYFLILRIEDCLYKIYAGKARCLSRRLNDYANEFQPHSPNDYKLRFFRDFMLRHEPKSEFDLYFQKSTQENYTQNELLMIKKYDPLVNQRDGGDRIIIQKAFEVYFSQSFQRKLGALA